jgi:hypothetical protein
MASFATDQSLPKEESIVSVLERSLSDRGYHDNFTFKAIHFVFWFHCINQVISKLGNGLALVVE